jgi:beta-glucosidase
MMHLRYAALALTTLAAIPGPRALAAAASSPTTTPEVEARAVALLKKMTLTEKLDLIGGVDAFYIRGNRRLGLPRLRMADGPLGVRNVGPSTAYAAGIALAATWDEALARRVGMAIGRDARARGVHFLLGPGVNLCRSPLGGRNFEYFGEDPFLAARMAVGYIEGVQSQGVAATVKHFVGNNSEYDRHWTSSDIDERTLRELYLPAFEAAVREAKVGAIMDAYNLVGGTHMTQHRALNVDVVKNEWGFDGIVMSDWDATYDAVAAANGGLDLEMPSGKMLNREHLGPAIQDGRVSLGTIDDKVLRILRTAIRFGWLDREQRDRDQPMLSADARKLALDGALASMVLLKNQGQLLPLDKKTLKTIAIVGPGAYPAVPVGGGSAQVHPFSAVSFLEGLVDFLADQAAVTWSPGLASLDDLFEGSTFVTAPSGGRPGLLAEYFNRRDLGGSPTVARTERHVHLSDIADTPWPSELGKEFSARMHGFFIPPSTDEYRFTVASYGLDEYRLFVDGKKVLDRRGQPQPILHATLRLQAGKPYAVKLDYVHVDHHARLGLGVRKLSELVSPEAKLLAARADVVVAAVGFHPETEGEGADRTFELPAGQEDLIATLRKANKNTIVVVTSGGGVDMSRWVDSVPAIVQAWYPGQEGGRALARLLFGDASPSGRLPVTFDRRLEDGATAYSYFPDRDGRIRYREGVFLGYRHVDKTGKQPLFPFGFGLSYTTFRYANLTITPATMPVDGTLAVAFELTNTGTRAGAEVAQVYVADHHAKVPRPPKELKGFTKVMLAPGETRRVQVRLDRRAFSYWDVAGKRWTAAPGRFEVLVGSSSQHIELRGAVALE